MASGRFTSQTSPLLDAADLADLLGLPSARAVYRRRERGNFPKAVRVGRSLRWRWTDVEDYLDGRLDPDQEGGGR